MKKSLPPIEASFAVIYVEVDYNPKELNEPETEAQVQP